MASDEVSPVPIDEAPEVTSYEVEQVNISLRPPVELVPGVNLSPIINAAILPGDAKAMLSETWIPASAEAEEGAPPPRSFDPAGLEYSLLMTRLSKSLALSRWNQLMVDVKSLELDLARARNGDETITASLDAAKASLAEAETQLTELKASFSEDTTSLVPWMQNLFDLVDAGLSTFEVGAPFYPHAAIKTMFSSDNSSSYYEGSEKILGAFKRRCDRERGPGKVQVVAKLLPNIFQDGYSPALVEPLVERIRTTVLGADSTDALDFVQLFWWSPSDVDFLPTLKVIQKLSEDKLEVSEETGEVTVTEPKKIRGIGLVDFPARAVLQALQAGVPVVSVQVPFSIADRSFAPTVAICREYGIKIIAREGLLGGLVNEKYVGVQSPDTSVGDVDLPDVAYCVDLINNYGGWDKVQALLSTIKKVADKHKVKMETVALRWQIDQGTFPVVPTRWSKKGMQQFGGSKPEVQLFTVESFLDVEDIKSLNGL